MYCIAVKSRHDKELADLLHRCPDLWRGQQARAPAQAPWPSGGHALDQALPWGGWPAYGLIEIDSRLPASPLRAFLPLMAAVTRAGLYVVFIRPPWIPFSPRLQEAGIASERLLVARTEAEDEANWLLESVLRSAQCGVVLAWPAIRKLPMHRQRRWQLAAQTGQTLGLIYRPAGAAQPYLSNAQLQIRLDAKTLEVTKARGCHTRPRITL